MPVSLFGQCAADAWAPKLGDPDLIGLVFFAGYVLAAACALYVAIKSPFAAKTFGRERTFWGIATFVLVILALNKQLDLQVFLTATARCVARAQGWYEQRRLLQRELTVALIIAGAIVGMIALYSLRHALRRNAMAAIGLILLIFFVMIRMVSFHHMDHFLGMDVANMRLHRWVEGAGLVMVILGGLWALSHAPSKGR